MAVELADVRENVQVRSRVLTLIFTNPVFLAGPDRLVFYLAAVADEPGGVRGRAGACGDALSSSRIEEVRDIESLLGAVVALVFIGLGR